MKRIVQYVTSAILFTFIYIGVMFLLQTFKTPHRTLSIWEYVIAGVATSVFYERETNRIIQTRKENDYE